MGCTGRVSRMTASTVAWYWGEIAASNESDALRLRHAAEDAELWVRDVRLMRGRGYSTASSEARRALARVGAIMRLRARGRYFVHAAGVVDPAGRAFVLAGDSGAGKSTLAFSLSRAGWLVLGDDGVVLEPRAAGVLAHPWRDALRVSAQTFPELADGVLADALRHTSDDPRQRVRAAAASGKTAPVAALVFVRRAECQQVTPLEPLDALARLVRQSPWVLLGDALSRPHLNALRHMALTVPALELAHTSGRLESVPDLLSSAGTGGQAPEG